MRVKVRIAIPALIISLLIAGTIWTATSGPSQDFSCEEEWVLTEHITRGGPTQEEVARLGHDPTTVEDALRIWMRGKPFEARYGTPRPENIREIGSATAEHKRVEYRTEGTLRGVFDLRRYGDGWVVTSASACE